MKDHPATSHININYYHIAQMFGQLVGEKFGEFTLTSFGGKSLVNQPESNDYKLVGKVFATNSSPAKLCVETL